MKLKRIRNIALATALAAVAVIPAVGANASSAASVSMVQTDIAQDGDAAHLAIATCNGAGATTGSSLAVAVEGQTTAPGAVAVRVKCGIVMGGRVVRSFQNALPGSVAGTAGVAQNLPVAPFTVCADVYALFSDGAESRNNRCPL
ncbi:MAG TPA: hypothetical protein VG318_17135 [Actinomycetota bacterium]|nr:hypothetical protein [Actinomycetota bacterium]